VESSSLYLIVFILALILLIGELSRQVLAPQGKRLDGAKTRSHSLIKWKPVAWLYLASLIGMGIFWTRQLQPGLARGVVSSSPTPSPKSLSTSIPSPTPVPTFTPQPTATPLAIPVTGVVWNPTGEGIYLWQTPGKNILAWLPNGTVLQFLDEWQPYGGLAWARLSFDGQEGWVDAPKILRLAIPEAGVTLVTGEGGYLYTQPQGQKITWLTPGTPVQFYADSQSIEQQGWVQVTLPDQQTGWLQQTLLQTIFAEFSSPF
jgi:hypothetical protein